MKITKIPIRQAPGSLLGLALFNKRYFRALPLFLLFAFLWPLGADEGQAAVNTIEEQQRDVLRFGTEAEIASLVQTLRNENISYLDDELIDIAEKTRNRSILSGVFGFFADRGKKGLEERAIRAIEGRYDELNETVIASIDYLGRAKAAEATDTLMKLIKSGESRFLNNAIRALGRVSRGEESSEVSGQEEEQEPKALPDRIALFLLEHLDDSNLSDENRRELISALGETESKESVATLVDLMNNDNERAVFKISSLAALSRIGDEEGMDAVIDAVSSDDPNVRSAAVAALGPFSGEAVESAILDGFRDSFYRTRIGAANAAGKRRLESAIPFLRFRANNDEVPAVKDEAIKALGAINNSETMTILESLFSERRNSDRVRLVAAEMLLQNNPDAYSARIGVEMDEAKSKNQTALYNGFIRIMGPVKSPTLEDFSRRLISTGGVIERSLALDLIVNNEFRSLEGEIRTLLDERRNGASIARKARSTLERLGFSVDT